MISKGLTEEKSDSVVVKANGSVLIKDLSDDICKTIIEALHNKFYLGRKIFCNGIIALTPVKEVITNQSDKVTLTIHNPKSDEVATSASPILSKTVSQDTESNSHGNFPDILVTETSLTALGDANGDIEKFVKDNEQSLNDDLVRRHSLSLRTPTRNIIANDILQVPNGSSLNKASNLLNEVRNLASRLSEYETSDYSDAEGDIAQDTRDDEEEF